jgi:hypothetical protein
VQLFPLLVLFFIFLLASSLDNDGGCGCILGVVFWIAVVAFAIRGCS